ncbi:MAG: GIY-YIG nuclease family protein [Clostridium sp.]|nr:GIY-YIG nuclease family protein [Clostridium sp.]
MIVYTITNKINGMKYVGCTERSINLRMDGHRAACKRGVKFKLYNAIREYGWENFEVKVIDSSAKNRDELYKLESYYVEKFDSINNGYNMIPGGDYNPMDNKEVADKHDKIMRLERVRSEISNSMTAYRKENPFTYEHRIGLSNQKREFYASEKGKALLAKMAAERQSKIDAGIKLRHFQPVHCIDEQGKIIESFKSITEAANWWANNSDVCTTHDGYTTKIRRSNQQNRYYHGLKWIYD